MTINTPSRTAPLSVWTTWWLAFRPTADLTPDQLFLWELGKGADGLVGEGTSFEKRITAVADIKSATGDGQSITFNAAAVSAELAVIRSECASEIAAVAQLVQSNLTEGRDAYSDAVRRYNAAVAAPAITSPPADDATSASEFGAEAGHPETPGTTAPVVAPTLGQASVTSHGTLVVTHQDVGILKKLAAAVKSGECGAEHLFQAIGHLFQRHQ